ncbi:MAG: phytanoyl-CoA dioxygenase family protein [Pseudomonadota bacterium]
MLSSQGYETLKAVCDQQTCAALAEQASAACSAAAGTRNLLAEPWCQALVGRLLRHPGLAERIPTGFLAVQCTYFEKSSHCNWLVPLHQDLSIPVASRVDHPHLKGWSQKEGVTYVQPPEQVLAELLAIRLHLDDCGPADGPLRVVPGSHRLGRLDAASMARMHAVPIECLARRGTALLLKPLILHASSKSTGRGRRRVLHILFGPPTLPYGLSWRHAVRVISDS